MTESEQAAATLEVAWSNLRRARRHAIWLERLAVSIAAFVVTCAFVFVGADPALLWPAAAAWVLAALAAWALLRGLALLLHLRIDRTALDLVGR